MQKNVARRILAWVLSVCMIAGMVDLSGFTVRAADAEHTIDHVEVNGTYTYTGGQIQPAKENIKVYNLNDEIIGSDDYEITAYGENTNVRDGGTVTITGKGDYDGTATGRFAIAPKSIDDGGITANARDVSVTQAGSNIQTDVSVIDGQRTLTGSTSINPGANVDYTYTYESNAIGGEDTADTQEAKVHIVGCNNYTGTRDVTFTIKRYDAKKLSLNFTSSSTPTFGYTGKEIVIPEAQFTVQYEGDSNPIPASQYKVSYNNNRNATTEAQIMVTVTEGEYRGLTATNTFTIRKNIGGGNYDSSLFVAGTVEDQPFKGSGVAVTPEVDDIVLIDPDYKDRPIPSNKYSVVSYRNNTTISTDSTKAYVTVRGLEEYSGDLEIPFNIVAAKLTPEIIHIDDSACVYDGSDQLGKLEITVGETGDKYEIGKDFTVERLNNDSYVTAGKHTVRIKAVDGGQLQPGYVDMAFDIAARNFNDSDIHVELASDVPIDGYTYTGSAFSPKLVVQYKDDTLKEYTDFNLSYTNNTNAGTATVMATGVGNFIGTVTRTFVINPQELTSDNITFVGLAETQKFTGNPIEPSFNVRLNNNRNLTRGTDYNVVYENQTNVGVASINISGIGNYVGNVRTTFEIVRRAITDGTRITVPNSLDYTGNQLMPEVTITLNNVAVNPDNYDISYGENIQVGTNAGTVTITGKNNYEGETTVTFNINRRNISVGNFLEVKSTDGPDAIEYDFINDPLDQLYYRYDGTDKEPKLQVSFGGEGSGMDSTALVEGEDADYTVTFSNNCEVGTAQATITGQGNFTGSKTVQFKVKGNLEDYSQTNGFTKINIPTQVYTRKEIIPENTEIKFAEYPDALRLNTDFRIERCEDNINVTDENHKAKVWIVGIGDYYGEIDAAEFEIRPLYLDGSDDLAANKYIITGINESYIYSGLEEGIMPQPSITHNGDTLLAGTGGDYTFDFFQKGALETAIVPVNVGNYTVQITGDDQYYKGSTEQDYEIKPYDISASYARDKIEIQGVEDVILDAVKDPEAYGYTGKAVMDGDAVIQSGLKVMYTPVAMDGTPGEPRELTEDEFTISYEKDGELTNTTIGTATITITGIGNFEGTITKEFQIRGDLSGENTEVTVDDWTYTPERNGQTTNCPEPTVIYTIHYTDGTKEALTLVANTDYKIEYQGNENATSGTEKAASVVISAVENGNYLNSAEPVAFQVKQRDIAEAAAEGEDKLLTMSGLVEEGYEYNGEAQVPDLVLSYLGAYAGTNLTRGTGDGVYDYEVTAVNNVDVYTYVLGSTGERERLHPEATVSARKDEEGNYVGNYYGEFKLRFQINPREISDATIEIAGVEEIYAYTGDPIRPELAEDAVTWSKGGSADKVVLVPGTDYSVSYGEAKDNIRIGEGKVTVTAVPESNYAGTAEKTFKIMADLEAGRVSNPPYIILRSKGVDPDEFEAPYGAGEKVYPDMVFEDWSGVYCELESEPKELQMGVDYEIIEEANNTDVGEKDAAYIRIRGKDYYMGEIEIHYTITPMNLSEDTENHVTAEFRNSINDEEHENAYIYTGEPITPEMIIRNRLSIMVPSRDYEVVRYENNTDISTEDAKARVLIRGIEGTNYTGEKWFEFNIIPRSIENMELTVDSQPQVFSRTEKRPGVSVSFRNENNQLITLTEGVDYDVAYANNILPATADSGETAPTITITGKGAYGGEVTATFTIEPESFAEENEDIVITGSNVFYTGDPVETTFSVTALDGTVLEENVDYEIGEYSENLEPGTGYAEIKGIGNYTGSRKVAFLIVPPEGDFIIEDIPDQTYNTFKFEPEIQVSFHGEEITIPVTEGKDYRVEYGEGNTDVGTGTVRVIGLNSFADIDAATKSFTILPKNIGTPDNPDPNMVLSAADQIFTGRSVKPEIQLAFRNGANSSVSLEEGKDYSVNCSGNVAVGIATATVIGTGNYIGVLQTQFRIVGDLKDATVAEIPIQEYTGQQIRPVPNVSFAGEELLEGTDYTIEYGENIEEGTGSIVLTGTGASARAGEKSYIGTKTVTFEISRERNFSEDTIVVGVAEAYPYTGEEIRPVVVRVEDHGNVLTEGVDYSVSYRDNINAGTASVVITGMDRYKGEKVQTFQIRPMQIARAQVSAIADQTYNGQEIHPAVQVQSADGSIALTADTDYTLVYVNSKTPGKASVIVRGMGNYTGAQTVSFNILVPKLSGVKVSGYGSASLTFSWKSNPVVSGYEVYNSDNRPAGRVERSAATSLKVNKLKAATTANYRVRAFVIDDGQYYYGPFTTVKGTTAPQAAKIKSVVSKKSKQAVIKWGKVSKATGYQVYRATSKNGTYKRIATTTKTSYTDKSAKGGRKYFYKIRTYRKVSSKNYFSGYSSAKSVTTKK